MTASPLPGTVRPPSVRSRDMRPQRAYLLSIPPAFQVVVVSLEKFAESLLALRALSRPQQ